MLFVGHLAESVSRILVTLGLGLVNLSPALGVGITSEQNLLKKVYFLLFLLFAIIAIYGCCFKSV